MKQRLRHGGAFVALALVLVGSVLAQPASKPVAPAVQKHSLWVVAGKSNVVYLLGSFHLLKPTDYPLAAPLEAAFSNAPIAAFETDIGQLEQPDTQMKMAAKAQLPDGETLDQQLSPATYAGFSKIVTDAGLPLAMFDHFKPSMASMTIEVLEIEKLGFDPEYGVDKHFFERARQEGKQIVPLETVDFQIQMATEFSKEEGELLMKSTLKEVDDTKKLFGEMTAAWKTGDSVKIESLLNDAMRESPAIYKRLLTDRSKSWVPKIEGLLRGNRNAVVIVGAGHLVGNEGVVELLRKNGWKVTQL